MKTFLKIVNFSLILKTFDTLSSILLNVIFQYHINVCSRKDEALIETWNFCTEAVIRPSKMVDIKGDMEVLKEN